VETRFPWFRSHLIQPALAGPTSPVYYGKKGRYRFDDPRLEYGVLYVAQDPHGAFIETFGQLGDTTVALPRSITTITLAARSLSELRAQRPLRLADLTGNGLAKIGADSRLFSGPWEAAQPWSRAIFEHPSQVDGIFYRSRHDPSRKSAAIFDRGVRWIEYSRTPWLSLASELRDILNHYSFALIGSEVVETPRKKGPIQEKLHL